MEIQAKKKPVVSRKPKSSAIPPPVIDRSVKSYGTNNGIVAYNVTIPEDSTGLLVNNYIFNEVKVDYLQARGYKTMEAKPKKGKWQSPFYAVLEKEDSIVKSQNYHPIFPVETSSRIWGLESGDTIYYNAHVSSTPSTPEQGSYFIFKQRPSRVLFGDYTNQNTWIIWFFK